MDSDTGKKNSKKYFKYQMSATKQTTKDIYPIRRFNACRTVPVPVSFQPFYFLLTVPVPFQQFKEMGLKYLQQG